MYCSAKQTLLPDRPSDHIVQSDRDRVFGSDGLRLQAHVDRADGSSDRS